jgi:mannosyltransferase OCH1-like enzyme
MIPKVFHRYWTGGPLPTEMVEYGATWADQHPDWRSQLWTDDDLPELQNQKLFNHAADWAPRNQGQFKADVVRYELLHRYGGVWVDTDFECLKPINELLYGVGAFVAWETQDVWANNAIMGAVEGHPFLRALIERLPARVERANSSRPAVMSGPQFLTEVLKDFPGVHVFPQGHFYPYLWNELHRKGEAFPEAYAVHHWNNARRRR